MALNCIKLDSFLQELWDKNEKKKGGREEETLMFVRSQKISLVQGEGDTGTESWQDKTWKIA